MRRLILVKHSAPGRNPLTPAREWRLSATGRNLCRLLAHRLAPYRPQRIFTSREPKALETARLLGQYLGKPVAATEGLEEQERSKVGWLEPAALEQKVAALFDAPSRRVFGSETADQAHRRFASALNAILEANKGTVLVVSHGTVISRFVSRATGLDAFSLWRRLGLPSFVVLSLPELRLKEVVEQVGTSPPT
jgi:broad specificity phosphatase PhoE